MNAILKIMAAVLLTVGILAVSVGGSFTWTETEDVGPFVITESESFNYPVWGGVGAIIAGVVMLLVALVPTQRPRT